MTANLARILDWNRYRHDDRTALIYEEQEWTYAELDDEVNAIAAGLRSIGLGEGDILALVARNSPAYLITTLAVAKIGGVFLPLNTGLHRRDFEYLLGHAGAVAVATEEEFFGVVSSICAELPEVRRILSLSPDVPDGWVGYHRLLEDHAGERVETVDRDDDDLQRILYTSGTTSRPKGAMITHGNCNANMDAQVVELGLTRHDRILNFAPLYHVGGLDIPGFGTWYVGATMILLRKFDARRILEVVSRERITGMVMVATMVHLIRKLEDRKDFDTDSVKWLIFSQVPESLYHETREVFAKARLIEGYGMTETCNGVSYLDEEHMLSKTGSVGRPMPRVDIRVVDESGAPVPVGELGEIVMRGPTVGPGYWRDPAATAAAHRNGWFHSGDVGRFDEDGYLYVIDRLKDMIRSGGENIASSEIEEAIYQHPAVYEAAVIGVPHPKWVETPKAYVVLHKGMELTSDQLAAHCREHLAGFKMPRYVEFLDELPRNPTGKVLKTVLKEQDQKTRNDPAGGSSGPMR
ncbi:MAG: long-chain fatty acid--CoA ligase [bacterium]|nr:long-chain fatty acid--CoA ligase [Acidimicrobiia bacterium]MCY4649798.1 long-chain fatty acid--CoA ligase [bacterium]